MAPIHPKEIAERSIELRRQMLTAPARQHDILRNQIVEANMGLVTNFARRLGPPFGFVDDAIDDVRSEIAVVLVELIDDWNPDDGPLGALLWVAARERIRRMRDLGTGWGQARQASRAWAKVQSNSRRLEANLGRTPDDQELAAETGISASEIRTLRDRFSRSSYSDVNHIADTGAAVAAVGESSTFIGQMAALVDARDAEIGRVFRERFGIDGPPPPEPVEWATVAERCGCSVRTAQRHVVTARQWVAEWLAEAQ